MALDEVLQIRLTAAEKAKIFRLAAQRSIATGKRLSAGDTLRELAMTALDSIESDVPSQATSGNDELIEFKPAPEVSQAIKRARLNSGESTDKVINALLAEALQLEAGA